MAAIAAGQRSLKWPEIFTYPRPLAGKTQRQQSILEHLESLGCELTLSDDKTDDDLGAASSSDDGANFDGDGPEASKLVFPTKGDRNLELGLPLVSNIVAPYTNDGSIKRRIKYHALHPVRKFMSPIRGPEQNRRHFGEEEVIPAYFQNEAARAKMAGMRLWIRGG